MAGLQLQIIFKKTKKTQVNRKFMKSLILKIYVTVTYFHL